MDGPTFSLLLILACFAGVALIAWASHRSVIDPATGRPPPYWQPWRVRGIALCVAVAAAIAIAVAIIAALDPGR